jgi:hypothetical protein
MRQIYMQEQAEDKQTTREERELSARSGHQCPLGKFPQTGRSVEKDVVTSGYCPRAPVPKSTWHLAR